MSAPWIVAFVLQTVLLVALLVVVAGLLQRATAVLEEAQERLRTGMIKIEDLGGLLPGERVGPFAVLDAEANTVRRDDLLREPAIFLFVDSDCEPCELVAEELGGPVERIEGVPFYAVMQEPPDGVVRPPYADLRPLIQRGHAASHAFQNSTAPQAFAVATDGTVVAKAIPRSAHDIEDLARELRKGGDKAGTQTEVHLGS
ncbi:MAG TPA: hypothetical protein VHJ76_03140 [Actinomycetota bacterium]|nr:hypothetical protein [Actinomycetota bacterium]